MSIPAVPTPPDRDHRRRLRLVAGGALALVAVAALSLLTLGRTLDRLIAATRAAEGDPVWVDYFIAQDCLLDTVIDQADAALGPDTRSVLTVSERLASHVSGARHAFADLTILPTQGPERAARHAIDEHYRVWEQHLADARAALASAAGDPGLLPVAVGGWIQEVVGASEAIGETFAAAEAAFLAAAGDDATRGEIDVLFTPSEAGCTRGAV